MRNADMPAAPIVNSEGAPTLGVNCTDAHFAMGLTKREAFAMAAMQGLLTNASLYACTEKDTAKAAVLHADALLAALEAQP
jgi:hypothetical protein